MALLDVGLGESLVLAVAPLLAWAHFTWFSQVQQQVPQPYLDEVFHIPQANAFWHGNWSHWDDKITTPPGLYLYSICAIKAVTGPFEITGTLSPYQLRLTNYVLVYLLMLACMLWRKSTTTALNIRHILVHHVFLVAFPLLFFFSALYYTDIFAALTVISTYGFWQAGLNRQGSAKFGFQLLHLLSGAVSLLSRQTNIFWSAVFLGGLQTVHTVKQTTRIHDPPITDAYFEDLPTAVISLISSALPAIPRLLFDLWPQLSLLTGFTAFVLWNNGVVLGDKSNHVAGIHLAQMLYIWPFLVFFSWPVLVPHAFHLRQNLPRAWVMTVLTLVMLAVVHYNTIVHPFLLADNRHYAFYVFKILRSRPFLWYAMVPVYAICAWLSMQALGSRSSYAGGPGVEQSRGRRVSTASGRGDVPMVEADSNRTSFLLVWLISTSLSLVTAPLVEPRYFLVPWLIWRIHVPNARSMSRGAVKQLIDGSRPRSGTEYLLRVSAEGSLLIELVWYMLLNYVTCRLFLSGGFQWPQEPGKVQRFMW